MSNLYPLPPDGEAATENMDVAFRAWVDHARTLHHTMEVYMARWSNQAVHAERLAEALDFYARWFKGSTAEDHDVLTDGGDRARAALAAYRDEDQYEHPF